MEKTPVRHAPLSRTPNMGGISHGLELNQSQMEIRKLLYPRVAQTVFFAEFGLSNRKIAERMGISEQTVKNMITTAHNLGVEINRHREEFRKALQLPTLTFMKKLLLSFFFKETVHIKKRQKNLGYAQPLFKILSRMYGQKHAQIYPKLLLQKQPKYAYTL